MTKILSQVMLSVSLGICMIVSAYAYTGYGICNFGSEAVPVVICYGPAVLKGTTVSGDVKVAGPLTADSITAGSLSVTGSVEILDSKINGPVVIIGSFTANNVTFNQGMQVTSDNIQLHHVKVKGSVTINSSDSTPYLGVECGTLISGDVTFVGKAGIIQITDDSIIQGKVHNGAMEFVKRKC